MTRTTVSTFAVSQLQQHGVNVRC